MVGFCICRDLANIITALSTFILAAATVIIGIAAYLQYEKNSKIKRAEFLMSLYEKFYGNDELKEIRSLIDIGEDKTITQKDFEKMKETKEEKFADYLNFFQFIVVLKNLGQIKEDEIKQMFHYYLKLIKKNDTIMQYLTDNDYKELKAFLLEYKDDK